MTLRTSVLIRIAALAPLVVAALLNAGSPARSVGPSALGTTVYGATGGNTGAGTLYTINPNTGATTIVGAIRLSGTLPIAITGLAVHPLTGVLYGTTSSRSTNIPGHLVTIDKTTGTATDVGSHNLSANPGCTKPGPPPLQDIAFRADGTLFGVYTCQESGLYTINLSTGAATLVGRPAPTGGTATGNGLSFLPLLGSGQQLYWTPETDAGNMYTLDPATGSISTTIALGGSLGAPINALTSDPTGAVLLGVTTGPGGGPPHELVAIDTAGNVTDRGAVVSNMDAIALDMANAPAAVTLSSFTASSAATGVSVAWQTAAEIDTVGFNVWRRVGSDGWQKINGALIPAKGVGGAGGSRYTFGDATAQLGQTYEYKLEMIGASGRVEWAGPVTVTVTRPAGRGPRR